MHGHVYGMCLCAMCMCAWLGMCVRAMASMRILVLATSCRPAADWTFNVSVCRARPSWASYADLPWPACSGLRAISSNPTLALQLVPCINRSQGAAFMGLYADFAMANHSCEPNTIHYVAGPHDTMVVRATRDIAAGERPMIPYPGAGAGAAGGWGGQAGQAYDEVAVALAAGPSDTDWVGQWAGKRGARAHSRTRAHARARAHARRRGSHHLLLWPRAAGAAGGTGGAHV